MAESYETWLPIGEVQQQTGMSERSVYRAVNAGKLRQAQRPIPGRKPLPVYHPDDVAALAQSAIRGRIEIMPPLAGPKAQLPPPEFWEALIERLGPPQRTLPPVAEPEAVPAVAPELPPLAELRQKLIVSANEAQRLGFSRDALRKAVREFRIECPSRGRYRMADLERLAGVTRFITDRNSVA